MSAEDGSFLAQLADAIRQARRLGWRYGPEGGIGFTETPLDSMPKEHRDSIRNELEARIGRRIRSNEELKVELIRAVIEMAKNE